MKVNLISGEIWMPCTRYHHVLFTIEHTSYWTFMPSATRQQTVGQWTKGKFQVTLLSVVCRTNHKDLLENFYSLIISRSTVAVALLLLTGNACGPMQL